MDTIDVLFHRQGKPKQARDVLYSIAVSNSEHGFAPRWKNSVEVDGAERLVRCGLAKRVRGPRNGKRYRLTELGTKLAAMRDRASTEQALTDFCIDAAYSIVSEESER